MAASEEEAAGGDVAAAAVTTLALTNTTQLMAGFYGVDCCDFRRRFYVKEFDKAGSDGRLYVVNNCKSDKDTCHIQKVQQVGKDDGKGITLVPYSREANGNNKLGVNGNPNESKEHISA